MKIKHTLINRLMQFAYFHCGPLVLLTKASFWSMRKTTMPGLLNSMLLIIWVQLEQYSSFYFKSNTNSAFKWQKQWICFSFSDWENFILCNVYPDIILIKTKQFQNQVLIFFVVPLRNMFSIFHQNDMPFWSNSWHW